MAKFWIDTDACTTVDDYYKIVKIAKEILDGHGCVGSLVNESSNGIEVKIESDSLTDIYHVTENLQEAGFGGTWDD